METILIFAGGDSISGSLSDEMPEADLVVAADSGYDLAVREGFVVDVLIGDMDSIQSEVIPNHVIVEHHPADKSATDLELALDRVVAERPARVVIVGGAGGRVDHELAGAALITSERWEEIDEIDWVTDRAWSYVVRKRRIIHGDVGATISLIPMGGPATGVTTGGLHWPLDNATLPHGTTHGVSNLFSGPVADIRVSGGCLLVVVPANRPDRRAQPDGELRSR
ncbi:MAG TPA: thiamine diphosphokinase [Acidimicrobiia bacterium]|nr:thiamine diphosphokinase [Acidimicrobiia bacterium]